MSMNCCKSHQLPVSTHSFRETQVAPWAKRWTDIRGKANGYIFHYWSANVTKLASLSKAVAVFAL